ncbi:MAG: 6-pyruvoyl-tetrahydropterin synthase-related protein, partial [Anaerolineales bacterium]
MDYSHRLAERSEEPPNPPPDQLGRARGGSLGRLISILLLRKHAWPASILALALVVVLIRIAGPGFPSGADSWGHLFKAEYLASQMHLHGAWAYVTTAWMPNWYVGDPFRTFYPPLTTLVLTPLMVLAGDQALAYQLFIVLTLAVYAALMYVFLADLWGPWAAGLGSVLALLAPYQLRTLFFEGNFPRVLAVLGLPLLAWLIEKSLTTQGRRMPWVLFMGMAWTWTLLAHPQQAFMFAVGLGVFVAARMFLDPDVELRRLVDWVGGIGLGLAGAAPWLLPAYSRGEFANVPFLPVEKVGLFSASPSALLPGWMGGSGAVSLGVGVLVLAILAAISRPEPRRSAWLISGLVTLWLAFGSKGVLFSLVPLSSQLLPERFLNFTSFALPVAAAGIIPFRVKAKVLRSAVVLGLVLIDVLPAIQRVHNVPFPQAEADMGTALAQSVPDGTSARGVLMTYPEPSDQDVYFAAKSVPIVNGWALENTPQQDPLRRYLSAPAWGTHYLAHLLALWNVKAAVVSG